MRGSKLRQGRVEVGPLVVAPSIWLGVNRLPLLPAGTALRLAMKSGYLPRHCATKLPAADGRPEEVTRMQRDPGAQPLVSEGSSAAWACGPASSARPKASFNEMANVPALRWSMTFPCSLLASCGLSVSTPGVGWHFGWLGRLLVKA